MKRRKFLSVVVSAFLALLAIVLVYLAIWLESSAALKDELQNWPFEVIGWAFVALVIGVVTVAIDKYVRQPKEQEDRRDAKSG